MAEKQLRSVTEDILNAIRANSSTTYQERVPKATRDNIAKVGEAILSYEPIRNEFLNALVNRIGYVIVSSKMANNPLSMFKKGTLEYGDTVEEIFVNIAKAQHYDPEIAEREVFKRVKPNVAALFHKMNRQEFYKVTVSFEQLQQAFLSYSGVTDLIARITDSLYSGDNYDEFTLTKQLLFEGVSNGNFKVVKVNPVTDEASAKDFVRTVKGVSNTLEFMSTEYNAANVLTTTPKKDQILLMLPTYDAFIDVDVLASAFNMSKAEFMGQRVLVDNFNGLEKSGVVALLVDRDYFMIWDNLTKFTEQYNAEGLYWNYFYHHWQILSYSLFANAVAFVTEDQTITGVTVEPETQKYVPGQSYQLVARVTGTGIMTGACSWAVTGNSDTATSVSPQGLVYIGKNESGTVTVTATSVVNPAVSGSATLTK